MIGKKWETIHTKLPVGFLVDDIIDVLLENRGLSKKNDKAEFLFPKIPDDIGLDSLGINIRSVKKTIARVKKAVAKNEEIIIYGDYDADGVCATAILWETLFILTKNVFPYIPNRFVEGYGINPESVEKIKSEHPGVKLIITVDNGIVAFEGLNKAESLGIDVIVTDHHAKEKKLPQAFSIVHTDKISGSGVAWVLSREIKKSLYTTYYLANSTLELAAIGTIADQLPLTFANRSIAKHGIAELNTTRRPGLNALFKESGVKSLGTYEINYAIAPRINAMGRMEHAIDSLRLICTRNPKKADELAMHLGKTNKDRQKVVEEVLKKSFEKVKKDNLNLPIIISGDFHEGVIGLAAGRLVEEFYVPVVVIARGEEVSKASARSISGFDIISAVRKLGHLILGGGGHKMAAGFSIKTENIEKFEKEFSKIAKKLLTNNILKRKLKIDLEIDFKDITQELAVALKAFDPTGIGNPTPIFTTRNVSIIDARGVGSDNKHLKLYLEKDGIKFNGIGFGLGSLLSSLSPSKKIDVAYTIEENFWNGNLSIQLKLKDLKFV